jgi:integrase
VRSSNGKQAETEKEVEARSPAEADRMRIALRAELAERLEAAQGPSRRKRSNELVSSYALDWLERRAPKLRPSTRARYGDAITKLIASIGHMEVRDVRRQHIEDWHNGLTGAPPTVNAELAVAKAIFASAIEDHDLTRSPAASVTPRPDDREVSRKAFSADEIRAVLTALREGAKTRTWYPLTLTLLLTGARFGEAAALRWEDVDEATGQITIRRAQWRGEVGPTKTRRVRVVAMHPELARVLREHRLELVRSQHARVSSGYVFPAGRTELHTQASPLGRVIRAACKAAKVEPPSRLVHALRRGFNDAVRRVADGDVVRSMTGHVTPAMTTEYSTIESGEKARAVRKGFARLLGSAAGTKSRRR